MQLSMAQISTFKLAKISPKILDTKKKTFFAELCYCSNSTQSSMDIEPLLPFFLGTYFLSTPGFGFSPPYIVNNLLVFLSISYNSYFFQLANAAINITIIINIYLFILV